MAIHSMFERDVHNPYIPFIIHLQNGDMDIVQLVCLSGG